MPKPTAGESQSDFVSRCIGVRQNEHPTEDPKQSSAICYSVWDEHKKKEEAEKLEKINEVKESTLLMGDHGVVEAEPETVFQGQYPEVPAMDLPPTLKKRPFERDWD
jgi:hypothetical protein